MTVNLTTACDKSGLVPPGPYLITQRGTNPVYSSTLDNCLGYIFQRFYRIGSHDASRHGSHFALLEIFHELRYAVDMTFVTLSVQATNTSVGRGRARILVQTTKRHTAVSRSLLSNESTVQL